MSWWFKRHPELLSMECDKLQSNSNYKEYGRSRKNILISSGEIIVRLEKTTKFPIVIIYSESTPYTLPHVIPLKSLLSDLEIKKLSANSSLEAIQILNKNNYVEFLNFWHQNPDGTICLLEADNLEKYGEFFSIREVINRVRDWLAGISTRNLPKDSPEVELFAHFRNQDTINEFLIPSKFLQQSLFQGEFYCCRMSRVYPDLDGFEKNIYLGTVVTGENNKGIRIDPVVFDNHSHLLPEGINSAIDLVLKRELLQNAINNGSITEGFWWDTIKEVKPIQNVNDFAEQVGNGKVSIGFERIQKLIGDLVFSSRRDEILLGIRFLNKRQEPQWQNFVLRKSELKVPLIIGDRSAEAFRDQILKNYNLLACRTSEFSDTKQHLRNSGRAERILLKEKTANIIGCGALGSELADTLGKAGVGTIGLVDFDRMKIENCIRHVLGTESIGLFKIHGLRLHIIGHNPFIDIKIWPRSVTHSQIVEYFIDPGVGISTIANDNTEGFLNEQALINNKVMFYGRALRGGKAARIFRVIPGQDACFYCLNLYSDDSDKIYTKIPFDKTLPTITNECNNPIRPSSSADLKLISSLLSQIVIDYQQGVDQPDNHWIWSTETINGISEEKIAAYTLKGSKILKHQKCPYCQVAEKLSIEIDSDILEFMLQETKKDRRIETGGLLLGEIKKDRLTIKYASEPGPNAVKEQTYFLKDKDYCQKYIDKMYIKHGETAVYIGEWHFHPLGSNKPSNTDLTSLASIANGEGYLTENPTMIILSNKGEASCSVHPARKPYYFTDLIIKK